MLSHIAHYNDRLWHDRCPVHRGQLEPRGGGRLPGTVFRGDVQGQDILEIKSNFLESNLFPILRPSVASCSPTQGPRPSRRFRPT